MLADGFISPVAAAKPTQAKLQASGVEINTCIKFNDVLYLLFT